MLMYTFSSHSRALCNFGLVLLVWAAPYLSSRAYALSVEVQSKVPRDELVICKASLGPDEEEFEKYIWVVVGPSGFLPENKLVFPRNDASECRFVGGPGKYQILVIGLRKDGQRQRAINATQIGDDSEKTDEVEKKKTNGLTQAERTGIKTFVDVLTENQQQVFKSFLDGFVKRLDNWEFSSIEAANKAFIETLGLKIKDITSVTERAQFERKIARLALSMFSSKSINGVQTVIEVYRELLGQP